jgi:hypothetical protein
MTREPRRVTRRLRFLRTRQGLGLMAALAPLHAFKLASRLTASVRSASALPRLHSPQKSRPREGHHHARPTHHTRAVHHTPPSATNAQAVGRTAPRARPAPSTRRSPTLRLAAGSLVTFQATGHTGPQDTQLYGALWHTFACYYMNRAEPASYWTSSPHAAPPSSGPPRPAGRGGRG